MSQLASLTTCGERCSSARTCRVARSGSLSGAARLLRVNPATVLRHIQQLELELETILFLREPSGYVRTSAGERLMARAEALEQEIFACQETSRTKRPSPDRW